MSVLCPHPCHPTPRVPPPAGLFLRCRSVCHFSRLHICAFIYGICFSLSDCLHYVWQTLGPCTSLQSIQFHSFLWLSNMAQAIKSPSAMQETCVLPLGWEVSLDKGMATHSSILAWRILWTEEPSRMQSLGTQKSWTSGIQSLGMLKSWTQLSD